jgi:hypothetical protein
MSSRVPARIALVAVALVACAWLVAGLRASDAESDAAPIVDGASKRTPPAEVARGLDRLRDARSFNADKDPEVNEVILLSVTGSEAESLRLAERVVTEEPDNVDTWFALWAASLAAGKRDRTSQALARVRELDPLRARILQRLDPRSSTGS